MRIFALSVCLFIVGCKIYTIPTVSSNNTINFNLWHATVMDSFERKTGYSKGFSKKQLSLYNNVFGLLNSYSEDSLKILLNRSEASKGDWDRLFVLKLFVEGETAYDITSILLYKGPRYRGISFDRYKYLPIKYIPKFKVWKFKPENEYGSETYILIAEFDKNYNNIHNSLFIGVSNYEVAKKILMIFDDRVFD